MKRYLMAFLVIVLAGIANSVMDQIKFHPDTSVFSLINSDVIRTWVIECKAYAQDWMYPFFAFLMDGWHFAKQVMVALFIGTITYFVADNLKQGVVLFFIGALVWMCVHILFYEGILSL